MYAFLTDVCMVMRGFDVINLKLNMMPNVKVFLNLLLDAIFVFLVCDYSLLAQVQKPRDLR